MLFLALPPSSIQHLQLFLFLLHFFPSCDEEEGKRGGGRGGGQDRGDFTPRRHLRLQRSGGKVRGRREGERKEVVLKFSILKKRGAL